ncbi:hypothetical protein P170DRAFT_106054 [Aspergillus steynii IBT 23096]|uniref:Uncharacterized protein n=1 Tax=Aspergillus steynii IBT 23096 TaxID=1392250 RepID=A0A2I2GI33_9EURO|nr:uncharacterized protein P170DRAFT_106054 [Aspergillus steynii IBT 23096]PLB52543.1 hypothetical protein P170DRAFT_106054 [Aspergillus steynii IBT 23096]
MDWAWGRQEASEEGGIRGETRGEKRRRREGEKRKREGKRKGKGSRETAIDAGTASCTFFLWSFWLSGAQTNKQTYVEQQRDDRPTLHGDLNRRR